MTHKANNGVRPAVAGGKERPVALWRRLARLASALWNLPSLLADLSARQESLEAALKADHRKLAEIAALLAGKEDRPLLSDALYLRFEERFRGEPAAVKKRLACYLPLLAALVPPGRPLTVLDLGCGRGEWLELLEEQGWDARGVDVSEEAAARCRSRGLTVAAADCVEHLRGAAASSLDAVTAFHLAEHLPLAALLELLAAARQALRPGGVLICETPNPINILVSACDFYRDPTHRRPLHPDTLRFLAEETGFARAESYFVGGGDWAEAPPDGVPPLLRASEWRLDDIQDYTRAPRDFALVAYK